MSGSEKRPKGARAGEYLDQLSDEAELERLAELPQEELDAELRKEGLEPGVGARLLAKEKKPATVTDLASRRRMPVGAIVLAVAAAAALVVGLTKRDEIVAYLFPAPAPTPTITAPVPTAPPQPSPQELANTLRDEAWLDCQRHYYGECKDEVDAANRLDPADTYRHQMEIGTALNDWVVNAEKKKEALAKPGLAPGERPLVTPPVKPR